MSLPEEQAAQDHLEYLRRRLPCFSEGDREAMAWAIAEIERLRAALLEIRDDKLTSYWIAGVARRALGPLPEPPEGKP